MLMNFQSWKITILIQPISDEGGVMLPDNSTYSRSEQKVNSEPNSGSHRYPADIPPLSFPPL